MFVLWGKYVYYSFEFINYWPYDILGDLET